MCCRPMYEQGEGVIFVGVFMGVFVDVFVGVFVGVFVDVLMNGFSIFMDVNGIKRIYLLYL